MKIQKHFHFLYSVLELIVPTHVQNEAIILRLRIALYNHSTAVCNHIKAIVSYQPKKFLKTDSLFFWLLDLCGGNI